MKSIRSMIHNIKVLLIMAIAICAIQFVHAQTPKIIPNSTLFQNRADQPIKIVVEEKGDKLHFYAKNRSLYSYQLKLRFVTRMNMRPEINEKSFIIHHGTNRLVSFYKWDRDKPFYYQYNYRSRIGNPSLSADKKYPYLVPLKSSNMMPLVSSVDSLYKNSFTTHQNDTIYCMRKGMVMGTPEMFHDLDRLSQQNSVEVQHKDGTIMVYKFIEKVLPGVKYGQDLYPGQPIAVIDNLDYIQTVLYEYDEESKYKPMTIYYYIGENEIAPFSFNLTSEMNDYPEALIIKEMSKIEIKKRAKGKLITK